MDSKRTNELVNEFGHILVASRNVGVQTLLEIIHGQWRPKNPTAEESIVMRLVELMGDRAEELLSLVRYATDLSFHKLLTSLEMGETGINFALSLCDNATGETQVLIDETKDRYLRSAWFDWLEKYGE